MKQARSQMRNIWMVTREFGDFAGAGGVKDVTAQLSQALAKWSGRKVSVVLPLYGFLDADAHNLKRLEDPTAPGVPLEFSVDMNYVGEERSEVVTVWKRKKSRVHIYFLDSPRFREKQDVYTYTRDEEGGDPVKRQGEGHLDYFAMNLLLQKGVLQLILLLGERPDVIHCHDGHTSVLPAIIQETPWLTSYFRQTGCLVTVHNAGRGYHQEVNDLPYAQAMTGLPWRSVLKCRLSASFDPLIAAGLYAVINTVSENYAREMQDSLDDEKTGWLGHHLLDMGITLEGITNGVDPGVFDPRKGEEIGISASFDPRDDEAMAGKLTCKSGLLQQLADERAYGGLNQYGYLRSDVESPLLSFIGRLSEQKGVDILLEAALFMLGQGHRFQLIILGSGNSAVEKKLEEAALGKTGLGNICFLKGYNPLMANRIYGGGDFFIVPSRYEPCGLTDFIAQLFANLPIVHSIGGLVKVVDGETGFSYSDNTPQSLAEAMTRAVESYGDKQQIRQMQKQAVQLIEDKYTWGVVMKKYLQLYKQSKQLKIQR